MKKRYVIGSFAALLIGLPGYAEESAAAPKTPDTVEWRPHTDVRSRFEYRNNTYPEGTPNQAFVSYRARVGLDASYHGVRTLVQVQDARSWGAFPGIDSAGTFAVHQGFGELTGEKAYLRVGRQEINLGDQRMIGALDWLMNARSFDGVRAAGNVGKITLDAFAGQLRPRDLTVSPITDGDYLGILQGTVKASEGLSGDLYVLYRRDRGIAAAPARKRDIVSPGVRLTGQSGSLKYTAEGIVQFGSASDEAHFAYAGAADLWYGLGGSFNPTLNAGFAVASGASDDGSVDEFENFFPTNHKFYGFMDLFGLRNLIDGHLGVKAAPQNSKVNLAATAFVFALNDPHARWSNAGGATLGQDASGDSRLLGTELDLTASYPIAENLGLVGGYSFFVPFEAAERLGNSGLQHWAFVMLSAKIN